MSEYGKLWEETRLIRDSIKRLVPTADTGSLELAKESISRYKVLLDILTERWEQLETEIAKLDD